ncbi:YciI family protein [Novosphingobium arvoryzae]|uniref:YCII-related domain-containing protein n=1 Tax=Novosphingobium arvoryzae TaxID=1256514 RepID=A0A918RMB7_9SPHN|nr:YciI family protein [Novosphingobium arvoryzae]GHA02093.1 hypothetical protein GCM10011617_23690 [Novosphingobium arvoryzae]
MFVVILRFIDKSKASSVSDAHNRWVKKGFDDGVFLVAGPLATADGGVIVAHNIARAQLEDYVAEDPFITEGVVNPEIIEFSPALTSEQLAFLKPAQKPA